MSLKRVLKIYTQIYNFLLIFTFFKTLSPMLNGAIKREDKKREIRFILIDISSWVLWQATESDVFGDNFYKLFRARTQVIQKWICNLLKQFPKVRRASVLYDRDVGHMHLLTMTHVFSCNKFNINLTGVAKKDTFKDVTYSEYKVQRMWHSCVNGSKALIQSKKDDQSDEEISGGDYDPMCSRNPHELDVSSESEMSDEEE